MPLGGITIPFSMGTGKVTAASAAVTFLNLRPFNVTLGRWRDEPIGPHPQAKYQVAFGAGLFAKLVPWLMLNRRGLSILVHPITDHDKSDHADFPLWLGEKLDLNIEFL